MRSRKQPNALDSPAWSASTRAGQTELSAAYGFADRAHEVRNTVQTQFGIASGTKTLTALTVMSLVERGALALDMTARSLLGDDLPLIADDVTIEQLLAHRSGIGDYFDEDAVGDVVDFVLRVPVYERAHDDRAVPADPGRSRDRVRCRRAVRVQQRRRRRARLVGGTGDQRGLPRTRPHPCLPARRHGRRGVPALR